MKYEEDKKRKEEEEQKKQKKEQSVSVETNTFMKMQDLDMMIRIKNEATNTILAL